MSLIAIGSAAAFCSLAFFFGILFRPRRGDEVKQIRRRLRLYAVGARGKAREQDAGVLGRSGVARRAVELIERAPGSPSRRDRTALALERASWPLRVAELTAIRLLATAGGALAGGVLLGRWWLGAVLAAAAGFAPRLVLDRAVAKRTAAFLAQLPDTLQLLAGSLKAGYGFMQAIDTLVKESQPPTSVEFARVLTEARLGMPTEDALAAMAERIGSDDFRWVVLAIGIQRQVGGNLAALLETVAGTLREREQVRRQIKVLSAEGRLSAWVLTILPFGIAGYVALVNPDFLRTLTGETIGKIMIAGAVVLMGLGVVWMRKIIRIEV